MKTRTKATLFFSTVLAAVATLAASEAFSGDFVRLKAGNFALSPLSNVGTFEALDARSDAAPRYFVLQFHDRVSEELKQALAAQGLEVLRYLPDDALVVRWTAKKASAPSFLPMATRGTSVFRPEWKISAELFAPARGEHERILVSAFDEAAADAVLGALRALPGVEVRGAVGRDAIIETTRARLAAVARIEGVEWIQAVPFFVTFDFQIDLGDIKVLDSPANPPAPTGYESGSKVLGFEAAWARGLKGDGQIAAYGDTGLDTGDLRSLHPDFGNVLKGYAMGMGSETWEDPNGHGTHVAGSIVGTGKALGGAFKGGANEGKLVAEGLWSALIDNLAPGTDFDKLMGTPFKDGARFHSNSWGNPSNLGAYDTFASKADEFMWNNPDMLLLFAAGNSGQDGNKDGRIDEGSVCSPGTAKNVLTVGASENLLAEGGIQKTLGELRGGAEKWGVEPLKSDKLSNNENGLAAFSSRGPTKDGRLKPEIVASGTNIVSTRSRHPRAGVLWGAYNADYAYAGGTSMATPITAGAATVVRQFLVRERAIANPSAALVKATLLHTAKDLFPGQYGTGPKQELPTPRPNVHEGYGRVDMDYATRLGAETQILDERAGVGAGEEKIFKVRLRQGDALRATLTYTDAPASAAAAKALVNDIDLKITSPSGKVLTKSDRVNNTEMLELSVQEGGDYTVAVAGINVPRGKGGKQPFALLISQ